MGSDGPAAGDSGDSFFASARPVDLPLGYFTSAGTDLPHVHRIGGDAGSGRVRLPAPAYPGPGIDPRPRRFPPQLRDRATIADSSGAARKVSFSRPVGCRSGQRDRPPSDRDHGIFGEAVVKPEVDE